MTTRRYVLSAVTLTRHINSELAHMAHDYLRIVDDPRAAHPDYFSEYHDKLTRLRIRAATLSELADYYGLKIRFPDLLH